MPHLFIDEILKSDDDLLAFFPDQDKEAFVVRALEFRRQGVFDTAIGDLVVRVSAQLLQMPIMVVTSQLLGELSIYQRRGIISLIPKKAKTLYAQKLASDLPLKHGL